MKERINICLNCRFWEATLTNAREGKCHRCPPLMSRFSDTRFPDTSATDWCGDFEVIEK